MVNPVTSTGLFLDEKSDEIVSSVKMYFEYTLNSSFQKITQFQKELNDVCKYVIL